MMLKAKGVVQPNPRDQFIQDFIMQFKTTCIDNNNNVIIGIDANSIIGEDPKGMDLLMEECELVDMYTEIHDDNEQFSTHQNGSKKIDYLLCTRNVLNHVKRVGYLKYNEGIDSDHRGLFCDISNTINDNIENITPMRKIRMVGSNSTNKEGEAYIRKLDEYYNYHRIYEKSKELYENRYIWKNKKDIVKSRIRQTRYSYYTIKIKIRSINLQDKI
jgi:hypothetical protein